MPLDQLELRRSFDRQVRDVAFLSILSSCADAPEQIIEVRPVGHETSGVHKLPGLVHPPASWAGRPAMDPACDDTP